MASFNVCVFATSDTCIFTNGDRAAMLHFDISTANAAKALQRFLILSLDSTNIYIGSSRGLKIPPNVNICACNS